MFFTEDVVEAGVVLDYMLLGYASNFLSFLFMYMQGAEYQRHVSI